MNLDDERVSLTMGEVLEGFDVTYRDDGDFFKASIVIDGPMSLVDACRFRVNETSLYAKSLKYLADHYKDTRATVDFFWGFVRDLNSVIELLSDTAGDPTHLDHLDAYDDETGYKDVVVINVVIAALRVGDKQHITYCVTTQAARMMGDDIATCIDGPELARFPKTVTESSRAVIVPVTGNTTLH